MSEPTSWRELLEDKMLQNGDKKSDIVFCNMNSRDLNRIWQDYYGSDPLPIRVYTKTFVYFSLNVEGQHFLESLPLAPTEENTKNIRHFSY